MKLSLLMLLPLLATSCVIEPVRRPVIVVSASQADTAKAVPVNYAP